MDEGSRRRGDVADGETAVEIVDEGSARSVLLRSGDSLADLPASHRGLITAEIERVFADPVAHIEEVARRCPFPAMAQWLCGLLVEPRWELECRLVAPPYSGSSLAGFRWQPASGLGAFITPTIGIVDELPVALRQYYLLVDKVHWRQLSCSGGLTGVRGRWPVSEFAHLYPERRYPDTLQVWGSDIGGDMLVYTEDDRGGWLEHEEGYVHWLGSIAETIDWVFTELLADREPDAFPENAPPWEEDSG